MVWKCLVEIENINVPEKRERLYYLDWLRVFAILMVFIFHNTHFFDFIDWNVKNSTESSGMMLVFLMIHFWSMPLFFLLAGAGAKFALDSRSKKEYMVERVKRLLIPLGIGVLLLAPPQGYVECLSKFHFQGSFFQYYPEFFKNLFHNLSAKTLVINIYHLWFLGFLLVFSFIALPLFIWLRSGKAQKFVSKIADFCDKKGVIFLFAVPILVSHLALRVAFPSYSSWADFSYWLIYFIYGYVLFSNTKFRQAINRHGISALVVAAICLFLMVIFLLLGYSVNWLYSPNYSLQSIIFMVVYSLLTWSWVVFLLSLGSKRFNFNNKFLKYSSEAVLPFYLLHQTIILLIGFYVVQWNMPIISKFLIISSTSLIGTIAIYEFVVKRVNFIRVLFGMKQLKSNCA